MTQSVFEHVQASSCIITSRLVIYCSKKGGALAKEAVDRANATSVGQKHPLHNDPALYKSGYRNSAPVEEREVRRLHTQPRVALRVQARNAGHDRIGQDDRPR